MTDKYLSLDLKTDREEEDRHQRVVDEIHDRHGVTAMAEQIERADLESHRMSPQTVIEVMSEREVDHEEREHRGQNQDIAAVGVVLECLSQCKKYF